MFSFNMKLDNLDQLVFFSSHIEGSEYSYSIDIEEILKGEAKKFDRIIVLCPDFCDSKFLDWFRCEDSRILSNLTRGDENQGVILFSFNEYGEIKEIFKVNVEEIIDCNLYSGAITKYGFEKLLDLNQDQVFLISPAGTVFKKPSGKTSRLFIRTAEMAVGCSQVRFVAYCLLKYRPKRENIESIYIDTSGIAVYIEALVSLLASFDKKYLSLNYKSFGSYSGINDNSLPRSSAGIWVVISASLSNNLCARVIERIADIESTQVVTILSSVSPLVDDGTGVIFNIETQSRYLETLIDSKPIMELEVCGENFYVPIKEPNEIMLKGIDKPISVSRFIEPFKYLYLLSLDSFFLNKYRNYHLNFSYIQCNKRFYDEYKIWIEDFVNWKIPISVKSVILNKDDQPSNRILSDMEQAAGFRFDQYDFNNLNGLPNEHGVLIISPVLSSGRIFSKLNSALRLANHKGIRVFVSPFVTFPDAQSFEIFKRSLCYGPKNLKYTFDFFQAVFLGDMKRSIWRQEEDFLKSRSHDIWGGRIAELGLRTPGKKKNIGLIAVDEDIGFTTDFAFWASGYIPKNVNPSSVFWTISAILQNVRDYNLDPKKRGQSLFHSVNQYSVLDPENFSRFNDPLIQSCLWRAAYSHEVNYSASVKLSNRFLNILLNQIVEYLNGATNGALDLLLAVAMKHIVLDSSSNSQLNDELLRLNSKCCRLTDLISLITKVEENVDIEF